MRPIFYDTETTGTRSDKDRIIELAAYDPTLNTTLEILINPGIPIPKEASQIHNITDEMVKDAPSFKTAGEKLVEFCEGDVVLIAHNNDGFDMHFLRAEFERASLKMPEWKFFDTLKWARRYRSDLPRHSLQFLREVYGIQANNAHRALDDVVVLHQVFTFMTDDLEMRDIYHLLNQPRDLQHMPFGKHQGKPLKEVPKDYIQWLNDTQAFDKPDLKELKEAFIRLGMLKVD